MRRASREGDDRARAFALVGSVQNSVGYGFLGNEALTAVAHRVGARSVVVPTAYASARGGVENRMRLAVEPREFARGIEFLLTREPVVLAVGYLAGPEQIEIVADALTRYSGLVVLDPVLGSYERGLVVSPETARRIRADLVPKAQVVTPNRFEAEVLLDLGRENHPPPRTFLDGLAALGPQTIIVTSFERDAERRQTVTLFSNGYVYERISAPFHAAIPGYGAGDVFTGAVACLLARGATPWAATVLGTALASLAVERTTGYGAATVDPVAALELFKPLGYLTDEACPRYAERFGVTSTPLRVQRGEGARLKF